MRSPGAVAGEGGMIGGVSDQAAPDPAFSVVIAAYQAAHVIPDALNSLLAQTLPPAEVIVADDASTDDLPGALARFGDAVTLLRAEVNGGEAKAKNMGIHAARSPWVVFLDADDTFAPTRLEAVAALIAARPDLDIVTTDAWLEVEGVPVRRCYNQVFTFEEGDQRAGILRRNFLFGLAAARREALLAVGGFDEGIRHTADWDLWLRMIFAGARAGLVAEPLARYRIQTTGLSAQRALLIAGRLQTQEKAARRPDLTPGERKVLRASMAVNRRALMLARAREALIDGRPERRRRSLAVARSPGLGLRSRVNAVGAALVPSVAGALLRRRPRETTGGIRYRPGTTGTERRILFYSDGHVFGGAEISLRALVAALDPAWTAIVGGTHHEVLEAVAAGRPGTQVLELPAIRGRRDVRRFIALHRAIRACRPSILHANLNSPLSCRHAIAAARVPPRIPTVAVEHLLAPLHSAFDCRVKRIISGWLAGHVAVGARVARQIEENCGLVPYSVRTIHNSAPGPPAPFSAPRDPGDELVIGSLGRLSDQKGYDVLLRAIAEVPRTRVVLVGDGERRRELEALADTLGLASRVRFTGWRDDARSFLPSFDVFALPSRFEGFPLSILEAMQAHVPVVATRVGSVEEIVVDAQSGLVVEPDDVAGLAGALTRLAVDAGLRRRLAEAGYERARGFTPEAMARAYEAIYAEILG